MLGESSIVLERIMLDEIERTTGVRANTAEEAVKLLKARYPILARQRFDVLHSPLFG